MPAALLRFLTLLLPDLKSVLKILFFLLVIPIAFFSLFFISPSIIYETIPLASPSQVNWYIEAAEVVTNKYGKKINWQELVAIDAVRLEQDFSKSNKGKALQLAEKFIWEEEIEHESCSVDENGNEHCHTWTEIIYHKYSLSEVLDNLNFSTREKEKVKIFLQNDLNILRDVGSEMPPNWKPRINEFLWPVPGVYKITSKFGPRVDPVEFLDGFHTGLDIGAGKGTKVISVQDGIVVHAGWAGNYGKAVFILHENYLTRYCHLSKINVREGDKVDKGQVIGEVGSTGKSTGPHLHFEVRMGNKALDPLKFYY